MDWTTMPTELLMMIFDELRLEKNPYWPGRENRQMKPVLRIRQVHPRWKLVMDELLEKWCLEYWTKWNADLALSNNTRYKFPRLTYNENLVNRDGFELDNILCPDYLLQGNDPPATKFVQIGTGIGREVLVRNDFSKYGHYLTSLSFSTITTRNPLSLATLARILHLTSNLKAVALESVNIKYEDKSAAEQIILPPLPHLEHVRLWGLKDAYPARLRFSNICWLLKPYKPQLVSLQTDECLKWDSNDNGLLVYPNLKRLKICPPSPILLKADVGFPSQLQSLSLGRLEVKKRGPITFQLVQKFISHFSNTLVELHLGIREIDDEGRNLLPRTYSERKTEKEQAANEAFGPPNFMFPLVKTFGIFFPEGEEEVGVVRDFLHMFPALETLKVFSSNEVTKITARKHLVEQQYWKVCPILKMIRVRPEKTPEDVIVTMRAPFSTESVESFDFSFCIEAAIARACKKVSRCNYLCIRILI